MIYFNISDIAPIDVKYISGRFWITYDPIYKDNDEIEKGVIIKNYNALLEVEYDAEHEDGYIAICKPYHPESFPLEFVKSLVDGDVYEKYFEWIKSNP